MEEYICVNCKNSFKRCRSQVRNKNTPCCSFKCRWEFQKTSLQGENNPNFGKRWSEEKRKQRSLLSKEQMKNPYFRWLAGTANRGKKFSKERCLKMHQDRSFSSYSRKPSEETKKKIGAASAAKFTPEFKLKMRKKMEEIGVWIPESQKTDWQIYCEKSDWIDAMIYFMPKDQIDFLNEIGMFNIFNNKKGAVRDHMLSRLTGFKYCVFPELLRHPANCQLLTHKDNCKKRFVFPEGSSQTVEELCKKIKTYDKPWKEQELCLKLVDLYETGNRYKRGINYDIFY